VSEPRDMDDNNASKMALVSLFKGKGFSGEEAPTQQFVIQGAVLSWKINRGLKVK